MLEVLSIDNGWCKEVLKIGMGKLSRRVNFPIPIFRISDPFRECKGKAGKWWCHVQRVAAEQLPDRSQETENRLLQTAQSGCMGSVRRTMHPDWAVCGNGFSSGWPREVIGILIKRSI